MANIERPKIISDRKVGNTTRLADFYIQLLFEQEIITIAEIPFENDKIQRLANKHLFNIIRQRLANEHHYLYNDKLIFNIDKFTISWKPNKRKI